MLYCSTSEPVLRKSTINYVTFETRKVETYGKGVPFTTMEKVETPTDYFEFLQKFRLVSNQLREVFKKLRREKLRPKNTTGGGVGGVSDAKKTQLFPQ